MTRSKKMKVGELSSKLFGFIEIRKDDESRRDVRPGSYQPVFSGESGNIPEEYLDWEIESLRAKNAGLLMWIRRPAA